MSQQDASTINNERWRKKNIRDLLATRQDQLLPEELEVNDPEKYLTEAEETRDKL